MTNFLVHLGFYSGFFYSTFSMNMVRVMGLEPIRLSTHAPQTCLSAYSSTLANELLDRRLAYYSIQREKVKGFFRPKSHFFPAAAEKRQPQAHILSLFLSFRHGGVGAALFDALAGGTDDLAVFAQLLHAVRAPAGHAGDGEQGGV